MPIVHVNGGFRWGAHGKVYPTRAEAERQAAAAHANGWTGDEGARPLYVNRRLLNADALIEWAKSQGFKKPMDPDQMHVTVAYSKAPVHWEAAGDSFDTVRAGDVVDVEGRSVEQLGKEGAVVLVFDNPDLRRRWQEFRDVGASWDWPEYRSHVTFTYESGGVDLSKVEPYTGPLEFGPERFEPLDEDWAKKVKGAMDALAMDKLAFDRASVRTYDQDGRLRVEVANISKAVVNPYRGNEIPDWERLGLEPDRVYQLLRDPQELQKAAPTFNAIPLLDQHVPSTAWDHPSGKVVGTTGTDAAFNAPYLQNSLTVWTADAIQGIESGEQRELSCGYRYRADMTPGTYDGVAFDGVMRDILGNHVALVAAGRAGPDVIVGDSQLELKETGMPNKALSRKATLARGALMAALKPVLAADAKLDLTAVLADVKAANWKDSKPKIIAAIKPKIAADADIQEIVKLLDSLDDIEDKDAVDNDPNAADPTKKTPAAAVDDDPVMAAIKEAAGGKLSDEECAALCAKVKAATKPAGAADDDKDDKKDDMVSKTAMDAALAAASADADKRVKEAAQTAEQRAVERMNAIATARDYVHPWAGKLEGAFDSAEGVYRAALTNLGIKHDEVKEAAALRLILEAQPKPGDKPRMANDGAIARPDGFADRFPGAAAVRTV